MEEVNEVEPLTVKRVYDDYYEILCNGRHAGSLERDHNGLWWFRCEYALKAEHIAFIKGAMLGLLGIKVP